jgi:DNA excision repair protein ERCC-1
LILAWTEQEAARYLETYKAVDGKDASSIQKREQTHFVDQVADFLTAAKPVNKTDAANLLGHFTKVKLVLAASKDELALCSGLGQVKVQKLHDALHKPFSKHAAAKRKKRKREEEEKKKAKDSSINNSSNEDQGDEKRESIDKEGEAQLKGD